MRLQDAWALCKVGHAKLIIKDQDDPLSWGPCTPDSYGTLYMWTRGHTVPMMQYERVDAMPSEAEQEVCVCGKPHGFPAMRNEDGSFTPVTRGFELWHQISLDERWEPVFTMTVLDAMIHEPTEPEDQES